jgi:hypothetical protein
MFRKIKYYGIPISVMALGQKLFGEVGKISGFKVAKVTHWKE